jgi:hypothetical protein
MGNGLEKNPMFTGVESPAIAHNEPARGARFPAAQPRTRDSLGNHAAACSGFTFGRKKEIQFEQNPHPEEARSAVSKDGQQT